METVLDESTERRRARRCDAAEDHGIVAARVKPARDAIVVNVSSSGALVETVHRLLPGTVVDLQLDRSARRIVVRGRVIRCSVAAVRPSQVVYRAAIVFERPVASLGPSHRDGNPLPDVEPNGDGPRWGATTRREAAE